MIGSKYPNQFDRENVNCIVNKNALKILVQMARRADLTLNEMDVLEEFEKIVEKED